MKRYKEEFIEFLIRSDALKFGDFTLKSGRKSPYFINTGCFDDGDKISKLGYYYASAVAELTDNVDIIFGPSYKGIPLALSTSIALKSFFSINAGYAFDRKEAKDHGDKGVIVGKPVSDDNVVIVDDVITSGRSIRESFDVLRAQGNPKVQGIIISVDRMEKGKSDKGALQELQEEFGVPIRSVVSVREIIDYLHNRPVDGTVYIDDNRKILMEAYLKEYGAVSNHPSISPKDRILVALDVDSFEKAQFLIDKIASKVGGFKIGKQLFTKEGPMIVNYIINRGGKVFLDLKFHDIPNTVAQAGVSAASLGVLMFNIHCSGGLEMMSACVKSVKEYCAQNNLKKPLIIGVTVLTSISESTLNNELGICGPLNDHVVHLAMLAKQAGLDGVVCSPNEASLIKKACGSDFITVTPGIRPAWSVAGDQKRIATPKFAVENGSDYMVIGRAITGQPDPVEAVDKIIKELGE